MHSEVFLGRQRIVDADRETFGYELLYRGGPDRATAFDDPDTATRGVMERVFLRWGMEHVVGDRFGLINASASLILNGLHEAMPPEGIIIEMREPEPFDDATVDAIRQATMNGFHFALDNVSRPGDLEHSALLPLASIVKIELTTAHHAELERMIVVARERSPGILVVAEKVENAEWFDRCVDYGFDLFQGYHLGKPEVLRRPARPARASSSAALARVLKTDTDDIDVVEIANTVGADPSLTFRLLAAMNADAFGLDRRVASIKDAIELLGIAKLRCLADLLASSAEAFADPDDVADLLRGTTRARMAAALLDGTADVACGVTVALLSVTDRLYETAIAELLDELPMSNVAVDAILLGRGRIGEVLDIIRACERGDRAALAVLAPGRYDELMTIYACAAEAASTAVHDDARSDARSDASSPV